MLALLARPGHTAYENLAAACAFACAAQRLLDRHRIAALAAGDVPGVTVDAAPEPMPPAALAAAFASPEPLDARWPELLRRADELFHAVSLGVLRVRIGATYDLAAASEAHRALEARETTGKVILEVAAETTGGTL